MNVHQNNTSETATTQNNLIVPTRNYYVNEKIRLPISVHSKK